MYLRRSAFRSVVGFVLAGALITPAFAVTGTVNTDNATLRVRSEASVVGEVLTKISDGTKVEVLSSVDDGTWYKISYNEIIGYVSGEFLQIDPEVEETDADTLQIDETPVPTAALPEETAPIYLKVVDGPLNIRSGPGTDYDKAGKLYSGRFVKATEQQGDWYKVEEGWINAEFVQVVDAETAAQAASSSGKGQEIADFALQFLGYPYVYGGSSTRGFDCSGFTKYVYSQFGYSIYRTASDQLKNGVSVSRSELQPGDLVMFKQFGSKPASHVGIYIGGGNYVHASSPGVGVIISSMNDQGYSRGYVGARRII